MARWCSFCGKDEDQAAKLIAGPGVYICNECVDLCREILEEDLVGDRREAPSVKESPQATQRNSTILTGKALGQALERLNYRERRVLELSYGLSGEHPRSLEEVGRIFNISPERVRQIEHTALKKLKALAR